MEVIFLVSVGILAAVLGVVLGRYVWPAVRGRDRDALAKAQIDTARLDQECIALRSRAEQLDAEHKAAISQAKELGEEVARLTERVGGLTTKIEGQVAQNAAVETQRDGAENEAKAARVEIARLTEREIALTQKINSQAAQLADQQRQLTVEFENIANRYPEGKRH